LEKERRSNLRRVIHGCRKLLEDEISKRLAYYGVMADGSFLDLAKIPHLTSEGWRTRQRIEQAIEKEMLGKLTKGEAVKRYIHHVAFTYLNRFAALRAMEVRGLLKKETIIRRDDYGGRSPRERDIAESNPHLAPEQVLKESLIQAFHEVGEEIKVLFEMNNEYSLVFPKTRACLELIRLLTEEVTKEDWRQDDVIGWIYQYFNSEARKEFRQAKRKPRADDIPIINQFYTPDWIVKALVDNTLGRLWLEMHPASKIKDLCTYFVPLKDKSPEREIKRVRDIKVLDPACGSGHFLVYALDLLYHMYLEDEPETPPSKVPALILENNLFGIDIDLRSVQLAALSLYLKAKTLSPSLKIQGMNLVCADVRIADSKQRLEFLERFQDDPALQCIFASLFEELEYTYEIGSLLKVRVLFERLFQERISDKGRQASLSLPLTGQTKFSDKGLTGQTRFAHEKSSEGLLTLVIPKERTIEEMLDELRSFEREAIEAQDMGRLLFATETEKSVGLVALLSQKYDVVLMNPPYGGDMPAKTKEYLRRHYPKTHYDYYAAFMEQVVDLADTEGYVGALVSRTFMFLTWFRWVRENLLKKQAAPQLIWDLGLGVLDEARHNWAAFTARKRSSIDEEQINQQQIVFVRLIEKPDELRKIAAWEEAISTIKQDKKHPIFYKATLVELSKIPHMPYSYWASKALRMLFDQYPPLDRDVAKRPRQPKIADVKVGLQTGDDYRFTRFWWEVPVEKIAISREETFEKKWVPFANDVLLFYFFADPQTVVNWKNDGKEIRDFPGAVVRSESLYFHRGLTWSVSINKSQLKKVRRIQRIPFRILEEGSIFGIAAHGLITSAEKVWPLLAICCSKLIYYLSRLIVPEKMPGTGYAASLPIAFPSISSDERVKKLCLLADEAHNLLKEWTTGEEISTLLIKPWILQTLHGSNSWKPITQHPLGQRFEWSDWSSAKAIRDIHGSPNMSLHDLAQLCMKRQQMLEKRVYDIQKEIDEEVYCIYGMSAEDRALIEDELALQKGEKSEEEEANKGKTPQVDVLSASEHIERLISYYVKTAIESDEDGIVPLNEMFPDDLVKKVRELVARDFGVDQVEKVESEMHQILGKSFQDWIAQDYFSFHVSLYRWRPIFWQLTSCRHGRSRNPPGAFSCFVHYHRLTHDTILKIRAFYLERVREALTREKEHLLRVLEAARATGDGPHINRLSKVYENTQNKIDELDRFETALLTVHNQRKDKKVLPKNARWVDRAIAEVRDNGWKPIIDHGVRVNIEPLKEAKLLHPAADRVK
jgi:SAM-dependent methyltransferase